MKCIFMRLFLAAVAVGIGPSTTAAGEPLPSIESVLAKWEEASQKCRILDAELAVFEYDGLTRGPPKISRGRLYYEAPNIGRFEIADEDGELVTVEPHQILDGLSIGADEDGSGIELHVGWGYAVGAVIALALAAGLTRRYTKKDQHEDD